MNDGQRTWLDEPSSEEEELAAAIDYDIVTSPNDWNSRTIVDFIDAGAVKIPSFQRNFVWDQKRASKLIESLIMGLPVPQVFLYEETRNNMMVIDGQQRLLTLYFFYKGRFPRPGVRSTIREAVSSAGLTAEYLANDDLFTPFKLKLPKRSDNSPNPLNGLRYDSLGDHRASLDLRTIRNMIIKQAHPDGDGAVFEIFSRLNTGGANLSPQEIRASMFHSKLFEDVIAYNLDKEWRMLVGTHKADDRMRDTEILFRALALARGLDKYAGSMANFVNQYCREAQKYTGDQVATAIKALRDFVNSFAQSGYQNAFMRGESPKFSGVMFEAVFAEWVRARQPVIETSQVGPRLLQIQKSGEFSSTLQEGSTKTQNVTNRIAAFRGVFSPADVGNV